MIDKISSILDNEDVNIFNYDRVVKKCILATMNSCEGDELNENLEILSHFLQKYLFDIIEEALRDDGYWDNYYHNNVDVISKNILELDYVRPRVKEEVGEDASSNRNQIP